MPKYPRYQDYVIRDGRLIGEFDEMYRDFDDPWHQRADAAAPDKALAINALHQIAAQRVIELGCGLGRFSQRLVDGGFTVRGVDVSATAIAKARVECPGAEFVVADILDFDVYRSFRPDAIIMAEVTWYVLDKLDAFLKFLKTELPKTHLIHLLSTYPAGVQQYGSDKFTRLPEMMDFFGMEYLEWAEIKRGDRDTTKTFFLGRWPAGNS